MKWKTGFGALTLLALSMSPAVGLAADHRDGPKVQQDPSTDINDVLTWTSSDGASLNLVMTVFPAASATSAFSTTAKYTFHTASKANANGLGQPTPNANSYNIICTFSGAAGSQTFECWAGTDDYAKGSVGVTNGVTSTKGKFKVYAGLRDDPFFFNLDGFKRTAGIVHTATPNLYTGAKFNKAFCPALDAATQTALVTNGLQADKNGNKPATDFFTTLNTLSIVIQIDKTLVTKSGPLVSVWASTNM